MSDIDFITTSMAVRDVLDDFDQVIGKRYWVRVKRRHPLTQWGNKGKAPFLGKTNRDTVRTWALDNSVKIARWSPSSIGFAREEDALLFYMCFS